MATPKYKQLVDLYAPEIANLKAIKARMEEAGDAVRQHQRESELDEAEHYIQERELYAAWVDAEGAYQYALLNLTEKVRQEYDSVPFGKAAEAAVDAFFREANI